MEAPLEEDSNQRLLAELLKMKQELALRDAELLFRDAELEKLRKQLTEMSIHQETKLQEKAHKAAVSAPGATVVVPAAEGEAAAISTAPAVEAAVLATPAVVATVAAPAEATVAALAADAISGAAAADAEAEAPAVEVEVTAPAAEAERGPPAGKAKAEEKAATTVQAAKRGKDGRIKVKVEKVGKVTKDKAATKLQAVKRGKDGRDQVKKDRAAAAAAAPAAEAMVHPSEHVVPDELDREVAQFSKMAWSEVEVATPAAALALPAACCLEKARDKKNAATPLKLDGHGTVPSQMRRSLQENLARVIDLFRQFDDDASGYIDGPEFVKAIGELGFKSNEQSVTALFASFDPDDSGRIEYKEMHDLLVRSVQHKPELEPLQLKAANRIALRKKRISKVDANMFNRFIHLRGTMELGRVPGAIREMLDEHKARVIDLFRQFDDDSSGLLDFSEFNKAVAELGMKGAPTEAMAAVFASFDPDQSGTIEYRELFEVIERSFKELPELPPLPLRAANKIALRTKKVIKRNANLLGGLDLDEATLHSLPSQIKGAMKASMVRVIDLFRQFDDDASGSIGYEEFGKAMIELGLDTVPEVLEMLFKEWDTNGSGFIEYEELWEFLKVAKVVEFEGGAGHDATVAVPAADAEARTSPTGVRDALWVGGPSQPTEMDTEVQAAKKKAQELEETRKKSHKPRSPQDTSGASRSLSPLSHLRPSSPIFPSSSTATSKPTPMASEPLVPAPPAQPKPLQRAPTQVISSHRPKFVGNSGWDVGLHTHLKVSDQEANDPEAAGEKMRGLGLTRPKRRTMSATGANASSNPTSAWASSTPQGTPQSIFRIPGDDPENLEHSRLPGNSAPKTLFFQSSKRTSPKPSALGESIASLDRTALRDFLCNFKSELDPVEASLSREWVWSHELSDPFACEPSSREALSARSGMASSSTQSAIRASSARRPSSRATSQFTSLAPIVPPLALSDRRGGAVPFGTISLSPFGTIGTLRPAAPSPAADLPPIIVPRLIEPRVLTRRSFGHAPTRRR